MPLNNDKDKSWRGWLVEGLGGQEVDAAQTLYEAIMARNIPKVAIRTGQVNMWWRRDSLFIDVTSSMDGTVTSTVHVQEYGANLFIGRAIETRSWTDNYYKRMATAAFLDTLDLCIQETITSIAGSHSVRAITEPAQPVAPVK
jgi:hypothetical protein